MGNAPKIKKNFIYNLSCQVLAIAMSFATAPYVSRVLGADNVGTYSYTIALANYFLLFTMLGVANYGNRTIAAVRDDSVKLKTTFWEIYAFQFGMGILVSAAYLVYCMFIAKNDVQIHFLQFAYVASGIFSVSWLVQGMERFKLITVRNIIVRTGMAAGVFLFVKTKADLPIYTAVLAIGNLLSAIMLLPFVFKSVPFEKPTLQGIAQHIKPNLTLFLPIIAISLYNIADKLMLGKMSTKSEVSFYTYAESIVEVPYTLMVAFEAVTMPRMANLYSKYRANKATSLMHTMMMFAMLFSASLAFGIAGVGPIFAPWFYGEEFRRCGMLIAMLCPVIVFKGWSGALRTQYIIPNKKDSVFVISLFIGAAVNLVLNLILIRYIGAVGAVIGTIAAEFAVAFVQFFALRKEIELKRYMKDGISFCLIGAIMYAAVYFIGRIGFAAPVAMLMQISVGAVIYILLASFYMIKIAKQPVIINEALRMLKIKYRFE